MSAACRDSTQKITVMVMNKPYEEHFNLRGSAYDRAMQQWPDARQQEFEQVVAAARILPGMTVADVPAGGGYLQRYLPAGCTCFGHEPCSDFTVHGSGHHGSQPLLPLPWRAHSVDAAISLAGVHHLEDKVPLFTELRRITRPGGRLVVSDVAQDSPVAAFLDGYVGAYNSTGHQGDFLGEHTRDELRAAGWKVLLGYQHNLHWVFADRQAMAAFCHRLFDIRSATEADTLAAIDELLGVDRLADGRVGLRWSLLTLTCENA